jgi:Protein of unknown function (DUF2752)
MISIARGRFSEVLRAGTPVVVVAIGCGVLLSFPPAQNSFYPRCPIYEFLHLQCPGCGATRALAALLRGHFSEAMHLNGFAVILLPIAVICGVRWYFRFVRREVDHWPQIPRVTIYATLAAAMIFTVVRNLPLGSLK